MYRLIDFVFAQSVPDDLLAGEESLFAHRPQLPIGGPSAQGQAFQHFLHCMSNFPRVGRSYFSLRHRHHKFKPRPFDSAGGGKPICAVRAHREFHCHALWPPIRRYVPFVRKISNGNTSSNGTIPTYGLVAETGCGRTLSRCFACLPSYCDSLLARKSATSGSKQYMFVGFGFVWQRIGRHPFVFACRRSAASRLLAAFVWAGLIVLWAHRSCLAAVGTACHGNQT
jgi:hypothetical protein